jgi:uncharacterized protein (TIRG00374 family)
VKRFRRLLRKPSNLLWLLLVPVLIAAAYYLPWQEILAALRTITLAELAALAVLNGIILLLFSSRWWVILRAMGHPIPYLRLAGYRMAGFAISYFSPGTQFGGEPLQAYLVQNRHGVATSIAVAAVSMDKLFELLANFTFLVVGLLVTISSGLIPSLANPRLAGVAAGLLAIPLVYLGALWLGKYPLTRLAGLLPQRAWAYRYLRQVPGLVQAIELQISDLFRQRPLLVGGVLALSLLIWLLVLFEYWLMAYFLGAPLSLTQTVVAMTAVRASFLTPIPGGIGLLEASQVLSMQAFGYSAALGITLSLLIRARDLLVGLFSLWVGAVASRREKSASTDEIILALPSGPLPQTVRSGD